MKLEKCIDCGSKKIKKAPSNYEKPFWICYNCEKIIELKSKPLCRFDVWIFKREIKRGKAYLTGK